MFLVLNCRQCVFPNISGGHIPEKIDIPLHQGCWDVYFIQSVPSDAVVMGGIAWADASKILVKDVLDRVVINCAGTSR